MILVATVGAVAWQLGKGNPKGALVDTAGFGLPRTFAELCALKTNEIEKCDIALMNLLCAEGLRGAENLNPQQCLQRLDGIARHVKFETDRHLYKFRDNPAEFNGSEGYYRMMMITTVLQQDLGIRYNPGRLRSAREPIEPSNTFFSDSRDVFILGLARQDGTGTCSSMPVFLVAVGRRLGYPLKLVKAKGHLFARWEDGQKSFNIEGTTLGFVSHPDEYYRTWPAPFTSEEERSEGYLKPLSAPQELAVFLSIRGHCLRAAGEYQPAADAFAQALYREPQSIAHQALFARAQGEAAHAREVGKREINPVASALTAGWATASALHK